MTPPIVPPRVKQQHGPARHRVNAGQVWPLETVVVKAGQRQIVRGRPSAVTAGDDVINFKGKGRGFGRQAAVFAPRFRTGPHELGEGSIHRSRSGTPSLPAGLADGHASLRLKDAKDTAQLAVD